VSRAFVKELDGETTDNEPPERPQSIHPNYIRPSGLVALQEQVRELSERRSALQASSDTLSAKSELKQIERDLRYVEQRITRAVVVDPAQQSGDEVRFGARVELEDEDGTRHEFVIVGEDETCAPKGLISWVSPLASALLGQRVGDTVIWERPMGNCELEIVDVHYS
jgi:transcription elongation GreA/GreB family factor